jgi:hypothetical protein
MKLLILYFSPFFSSSSFVLRPNYLCSLFPDTLYLFISLRAISSVVELLEEPKGEFDIIKCLWLRDE